MKMNAYLAWFVLLTRGESHGAFVSSRLCSASSVNESMLLSCPDMATSCASAYTWMQTTSAKFAGLKTWQLHPVYAPLVGMFSTLTAPES